MTAVAFPAYPIDHDDRIVCITCEGSGIAFEDHGQGQIEQLGCPDCQGVGTWTVASVTLPRRRTCPECPWRRTSAPGWLGPFNVAQWLGLVGTDRVVACHLTVDTADTWTLRLRQCAGAAQYRANTGKRPRDPDVAVARGRNTADVFATPAQFIEHHGGV